MLAVERRRLQLGWPMWLVDERSGVQSGYYAKMLYCETPSGRHARLETLQWVIDALWPNGIGCRLIGEPVDDEDALRQRIAATARRYKKRQSAHARTRSHLRSYASAKEANP